MQTSPARRLPRQIFFIIGNEACERFSFYGMRNILTVFLVNFLLARRMSTGREDAAKEIFHLFVMGVYLFPLLGGFLADRVWGKYRTVLWLSLVYCVGHAMLALFENTPWGFYSGLFLIALGSGGIKPCVSALVGDQFNDDNRHLTSAVFGAFYWSVNFGSLFASLFMPIVLVSYGPRWAFGIPGILMLVATVIFFLGRHRYIDPPPRPRDPHSFARVLMSLVRGGRRRALEHHPESAVQGTFSVLRVLQVFAPIPLFWAVFDQKASTWVLQARAMNRWIGDLHFEPAQMQVVNPLLVMLLIPLANGVVYPALRKRGYEPAPLRRMVVGMFFAVLSWAIAGAVQSRMDHGHSMSILWQLGPYVLLTTAEVLVSTTGLEFAYSQSPPEMKSTVMSFWNLTVAVGNLVVSRAAVWIHLKGATLFYFYTACVFVAAIALWLIARRYERVAIAR